MTRGNTPLDDLYWQPALHNSALGAYPYSLLSVQILSDGRYLTSVPDAGIYGGGMVENNWDFAVNGPWTVNGGDHFSVVRPTRPVPIRYSTEDDPPEPGAIWGPLPGLCELYPGLPGFRCCGREASPDGTAWFIQDAIGVLCWAKTLTNYSGAAVLVELCRDHLASKLYGIIVNIDFPVSGGKWPNVESGNIIPIRMESPGVFVSPDGCLDDDLGTIKIWPMEDDPPQGWEEVYQGYFLAGGSLGETVQAREHSHPGVKVVCGWNQAIEVGDPDDTQSHLPPYRVIRWIRRTS